MNPNTFTVSEARADLYRIVDRTAQTHRPVHIKGKRACAILVSEEDWQAIQETLYLLSIPGMRESILKGGKVSPSQCAKEPGW